MVSVVVWTVRRRRVEGFGRTWRGDDTHNDVATTYGACAINVRNSSCSRQPLAANHTASCCYEPRTPTEPFSCTGAMTTLTWIVRVKWEMKGKQMSMYSYYSVCMCLHGREDRVINGRRARAWHMISPTSYRPSAFLAKCGEPRGSPDLTARSSFVFR